VWQRKTYRYRVQSTSTNEDSDNEEQKGFVEGLE